MSQWQDISTAPSNQSVLVCKPGELPLRARLRGGLWAVHLSEWVLNNGDEPTHWMPLPTPPGATS